MSDQSQPPAWGEPPAGDQGYQGYEGYDGYAALAANAPQDAGAGLAYASWVRRVGAFLVDLLVTVPGYVVIGIGVVVAAAGATTRTDPTTGVRTVEGGNGLGLVIMVLGCLVVLATMLWNSIERQGRTGWSIGKQVLGIRLLKEDTGRPMGAGMCFVRQVVHVVDSLACYLGYLWPLWDAKRQTFADKIMTTVVVRQRRS